MAKETKAALIDLHNEIGEGKLLFKKELFGMFESFLKKHRREKVDKEVLSRFSYIFRLWIKFI